MGDHHREGIWLRRADPRPQLSAQNPLVALLLRVMDQAYDQKSWHGTTLRGSLRGLTAEEALWRPGPKPAQHLGAHPPRRLLEVHRAPPPGGGFGGLLRAKAEQLAGHSAAGRQQRLEARRRASWRVSTESSGRSLRRLGAAALTVRSPRGVWTSGGGDPWCGSP